MNLLIVIIAVAAAIAYAIWLIWWWPKHTRPAESAPLGVEAAWIDTPEDVQ